MYVAGIKIPENCVARVREELLQMDEEVKRRRKEREQMAAEKRLSEDRIRLMEEGHKHLLANLVSQKTMLNQSLVPFQNQLLRQKLSQNAALQQAQSGGVSQLQRIPSQSALQLQQQKQKPPQNINMLHSIQIQQRTPKNWPNTSTSAPSSSSRTTLPSLAQFYPSPFLPTFSQLKSSTLQLQSSAPSPSLSSSNPLDEILDLTVSSPSPSPDATEPRLNHGGLSRQAAAAASFDELESLISEISQVPSVAPPPPPAHPAAAHSMLTSNHQDLMEYFDLPLSPQMSTQKASPSSSTSSSSASSFCNSLAPPVPSGLLSVSSLMPAASSSSSSPSSSSLFSSPSSSSSLFSSASPHFPANYPLLPASDPLPLPNGHCSATALDVREALNSMLQAGADRKSVIQFRHPD